MIKAKVGKREIEVKTSWNDLTYSDFLKIVGLDTIEVISILTGLTVDELAMLEPLSKQQLTNLLSFVEKIEEEEVTCKDIREESFGKKILLQEKAKDDNKYEMIPYAYAIYELDANDIKNSFDIALTKPFLEVYHKGMNYIEQLTKVIDTENEQLKHQPTSEQRRAGLDMFDEFGIINTINALAGGNILNYQKVLEIEYSTVFVYLKLKKTEAIYQENYTKIMSQKR